jgi:hypothetical protein
MNANDSGATVHPGGTCPWKLVVKSGLTIGTGVGAATACWTVSAIPRLIAAAAASTYRFVIFISPINNDAKVAASA